MSKDKERIDLKVPNKGSLAEHIAKKSLYVMDPVQRLKFLEEVFLEKAQEYEDEATYELISILIQTYLESDHEDRTREDSIELRDYIFHLGELSFKLPEGIPGVGEEPMKPALVKTKVGIFELVLPLWKSAEDIKAFVLINIMFSPNTPYAKGGRYVSKAEKDKMKQMIQAHIERNFSNNSYDALKQWVGNDYVSDEFRKIMIMAMVRDEETDFGKRIVVMEQIFEGIDMSWWKEYQIASIKDAVELAVKKIEVRSEDYKIF